MKTKDIRELTDGEIIARIKEDRDMLLKMKFNNSISEIESQAKIRHTRKMIAKLNTIMTERENAKKNQEKESEE